MLSSTGFLILQITARRGKNEGIFLPWASSLEVSLVLDLESWNINDICMNSFKKCLPLNGHPYWHWVLKFPVMLNWRVLPAGAETQEVQRVKSFLTVCESTPTWMRFVCQAVVAVRADPHPAGLSLHVVPPVNDRFS